jgi:cytochrome o ubiquinol oxidase operon protein cyoD
MVDNHTVNRSFKPLVIGFLLSIALTVAMYFVATQAPVTGLSLTMILLGLGCVQALVQLVCFLHLGIESKPHWNLITFLFMVLILVVIVGGSLWIMYSLDYQMM